MGDSRRAFLGLLSAGVAGLAGCGSAEEVRNRTAGDRNGTRGIVTVDTSGLEGEALFVPTPMPRDVQLNPFSFRSVGRTAFGAFQAPVMPTNASTGEYYTSGHTRTVGGEEIPVPCLVADYAVGDDSVTYTLDDRFTYWNGEPVDARAFHLSERLDALTVPGTTTYRGELLSGSEFRRPLLDDVRDERYRGIHPGSPPLPPSFTEPWVERFAGTSNDGARDEVYADLNRTKLNYTTYVEKGYATGAYEIERIEDVRRSGIIARLREDHPGEATVPNLVCQRVGRAVGTGIMTRNIGKEGLDIGQGVVAPDGDFTPQSMPEGIEQLGRFRLGATNGFKLLFDWSDSHMGRLPVRRAVVAALPLDELLRGVSGANGGPPAHDSGMLSADSRVLGADFCDSLHRYPREADTERAAAWMREAGYTLESGSWVGPEGETPSVTMPTTSNPQFAEPTKAVVGALGDFGFDASWRTVQAVEGRMSDALRERYGLAVSMVGGGWTPANQYGSTPGVSEGRPYGGTVAPGRSPLATCTDAPAPATAPSEVTVPEEPGALRIEGVEYEGDTDYVHGTGETIDPCADSNALWDPELDAAAARAAARRCARWYNYALPTFVFAGPQTGVWGDTEAFDYPQDPRALGTADPVSSDPLRYLVQAGLVR